MHAACGLGGGVQACGGDVGATVCAFAVRTRFNAGQSGFHGGQVGGFALVQRKLQFTLGGELGTRVLGLTKVVGSGLGAADDAPALRGQLGQQLGLLGQQLLAEWGGLGLVNVVSPQG